MPEAEDLAQADAPVSPPVPLSIGEVLSVLSEEFPDITISKIRFLESQGLVRPERNASGYRQFGEADIERLRWILRQQRDRFLPLKVIKRALDEGTEAPGPADEQPTLWTAAPGTGEPEAPEDSRRRAGAGQADAAGPDAAGPDAAGSDAAGPDGAPRTGAGQAAARQGAAAQTSAAPSPAGQASAGQASAGQASAGQGRAPRTGGRTGQGGTPPAGPAPSRPRHSTPADVVAALQEDPRAPARGSGPRHRTPEGPGDASPGDRDPDDRSPGDAAPGGRAPGGRAPGDAAPGDAAPGDAAPGDTAPGDTAPGGRAPDDAPPGDDGADQLLAAQLGRDELLGATGLDGAYLDALEEYGLVSPTIVGGEATYDGTDLAVARAAARCAELGVGPRHLRIYKVAADREAGLVEQVVMPLLKQRNPAAREQAATSAAELTQLGAVVHAALLRRELGPDLTP